MTAGCRILGIVLCLSAAFVSGMEPRGSEISGVQAPEEFSDYVPRHIDVTGCLESEAKCCFITARVLKTAVVLTDVCTVAITTASVTQIKGNPQTAFNLGICASVCSGLGTVMNLSLMKINSKLMRLDKIFAEKQTRAAEL
jgi:hypothetical protein